MSVTRPARLAALDVLRGLAVAGMILVVSPGDWGRTYGQLQHAAWNGWTLADMVFPAFLFSVGASVGLSFPRSWSDAASRERFWWRLVRRVIALMALGLLIEASYVWCIAAGAPFPGQGGLAHVRLPGILQRIGLCYGLATPITVWTGRRLVDGRLALRPIALSVAALALLALYWALMKIVPVPGTGAGRLDPAGNLGAYIDRAVFGVAHLWPLGWAVPNGPVVYDPEGLLSSIPATANVLFGVAAATVLRTDASRGPLRLLLASIALLAIGLALDPVIVINKRIWTPSFALLSTGVAGAVLAALIVLLRNAIVARVLTPLQILGGNAILAFLLSTIMSRLSGFALIPTRNGWAMPQAWGNALALRVVPDPDLASLLCAIGIVALVTMLIWPLHRRAVHFRL